MAIKWNVSALNKLEKLKGRHQVAAKDLFHPGFVRLNTRFSSFDEMVNAAEVTAENIDELDADEAWSSFVRDNSQFSSWGDMKLKAIASWGKQQLK